MAPTPNKRMRAAIRVIPPTFQPVFGRASGIRTSRTSSVPVGLLGFTTCGSTGDVVVTAGTVVATGSVVVEMGNVVVAIGRVVVAIGKVVVAMGNVVVVVVVVVAGAT